MADRDSNSLDKAIKSGAAMIEMICENPAQPKILFRNRAAGILKSGNLLLLQRTETDSCWAVPGGKIEDGETAEHAFLREMDEELGWAPSKSQLACVFESMFEHESQTYQ